VIILSSLPVVAQREPVAAPVRSSEPARNPFRSDNDRITSVVGSNTVTRPGRSVSRATTSDRVVVAIDAGHGGQDPGAIGPGGVREKNVTIAIARKLRTLLNDDPMFKGVLTRDGDYFISVMGRSDVARQQNANLLVSIHADAAPNRDATGASVWVLSNRRANSEMASWLEQHEKQSELLGGAGERVARRLGRSNGCGDRLTLRHYGRRRRRRLIGIDREDDVIARALLLLHGAGFTVFS